MADNTVLNLGSGGDTIATDDIDDVKYPLNKIVFGADGVTPTIVSMTTGFPVALSDTDNAVLDSIAASITAIQTAVQLLDNAIVGSAMQVDVVSALVAGTANIGIVSLSDTDNSVLDSIAASSADIKDAVEALDNAIDGNEMQVDVVSVIPGAGPTHLGKAEDDAFADGDVGVAAMTVRKNTAAALGATDSDYQPLITDSTGRLHVKDKNSDATRDAVQAVEGAISSDKMQVDIVTLPSLPAGTENIGDVDVVSLPSLVAGDENIGNVDVVSLPSLVAGSENIGDVDVLSVIPGTGATNLGKVDDAAHAEGDVGVMPLAVRTDVAGTLVDATGDYSPLQVDSTGKLRVNSGGSGGSATEYDAGSVHLPENAGAMPLAVRNDDSATLVDADGDYAPLQVDEDGKLWVTSSGSGGSATEYDEDTQHAAADAGTMPLAVRRNADTSMVDADGDYAPLQVDADGKLKVEVFDGGDSLTVDNGGTFAVQVSAALPIGNNNIGNVDIVTLPSLVTGSANIGTVGLAAGSADIGTVALSDTDNAVLDSIAASSTDIKTAVEILDGAVSSSKMQVDVVTLPSLPAGSANIGDVDVLSVIPGTGATNLGKAEDAVHAGGDVGVMPLAVRNDTAEALGDDGDYAPLQVDSTGKLWVTSSGSGGSATEYNEDAVTPGTIVGTTSMMERDDVLTTGVAEADWAAFKCNVNGALWVGVDGTVALSDTDNAVLDSIASTNTDIKTAVEAVITGSEMQVDVVTLPSLPAGSANIGDVDVLSVIPGTGATNLGKAEDSVHAEGDVGVMPLAVRNDTAEALGADGDYTPLQVDEDGKLWVTSTGSGGSATEYVEDTQHADEDLGTMPLAVRKDNPLTALSNQSGDYTPFTTDGYGNLRTTLSAVDNAVLDSIAASSEAIQAAVEILDNAITGNEMQVDIKSVNPGSSNTSLGKSASNAHSTTNYGVMSLAVRHDADTTFEYTADGDYSPLQTDADGALKVSSTTTLAAGDVNIGNVDIVTLPPLVAGSANIGTVGLAAGSADIGTVALSDTDNAVLDSIASTNTDIKTAVEALDNAISGSQMQVDVVAELPAGTKTIGSIKLTDGTETASVNSSNQLEVAVAAALPIGNNNIGNVDIVTLPALVAGSENIGTVGLVAGTEDIGTVALSDTDNAVLDSIDTSNAAIKTSLDNAIDGNEMQVDVVSLPAVALSSIDNAVLDSIAASSADIKTAVEILDGAISSDKMQVDIVTLPSLVAGSANIGNVDIESAAATSSNMGAALMTNVIHDGTSALTPEFAKIDAASSNNTLVAAAVGKKIRVLSLFMVSAGTVTTRFESNTGGTALTGQMSLVVNSGFTLPFNPVGWFETTAGQLLNLELSAGVSVDGCLVYVEV